MARIERSDWRLSALWRQPPGSRSALAAGQPGRFYLLDGARALAALAVLFYHYQHFFIPLNGRRPVAPFVRGPLDGALGDVFAHGYVAVPIFWMISGFVFSRAYLPASTGTWAFMLNRVARLYPLHLLTLAIVAGLQVLCVARFGTSQIYGNTDLYHFVLQLFFASNWGFQSDYSFNAPIWSVSVEILIYAAFWAAHRHLCRLGVVLPLLAAAVFAVWVWYSPNNRLGQCGFFFFIGSGLYLLFSALKGTRWPLAVFSLAMIAAAAPVFAYSGFMLSRYVGIPGLFGGLLLLTALAETRVPQGAHRPLAAMGDASYGMYLWHVPIQLCLFLMFGAGLARAAENWAFLAAYLATVIAVAWVGYVWFERPMRQWIRGLSAAGPGRWWRAAGRLPAPAWRRRESGA